MCICVCNRAGISWLLTSLIFLNFLFFILKYKFIQLDSIKKFFVF